MSSDNKKKVQSDEVIVTEFDEAEEIIGESPTFENEEDIGTEYESYVKLDDDNDADGGAAAPVRVKKKRSITFISLVASGTVILVTLVAYLTVLFFFNKSIEGTWKYTNAGEGVNYYFSFAPGGRLIQTTGTSKTYTVYQFDDKENTLALYTENGTLSGTVSVEGNIFSGRKLTITSGEGEAAYVSTFEEADAKLSDIKKYDGYKVDQKLVARWETSAEENDSILAFDIKDDGTLYFEVLHEGQLNAKRFCVYTAEEGVFKFSFLAGPESIEGSQAEIQLSYEVDGDKLTITESQSSFEMKKVK